MYASSMKWGEVFVGFGVRDGRFSISPLFDIESITMI